MRLLARLAAAGAALALAAPAAARAPGATEVYVFAGRVVTFDPQPAILTLSVVTTNRAARRFRLRKVRFHVALADVEVADRTGDGVGLAEDVQPSDVIRVRARLNRSLGRRQPFEALTITDLTAPPR